MASLRLPRFLDRYLAFCAGRPARDGWQPTTRYRAVAVVVMTLIVVNLVARVGEDRGLLAAAAVAALAFSGVWVIGANRQAAGSDVAGRHPYVDAAWSIPIAVVFALAFAPESWPDAVTWGLSASYVALIFALTASRGARRRRRRHHGPTT